VIGLNGNGFGFGDLLWGFAGKVFELWSEMGILHLGLFEGNLGLWRMKKAMDLW
jgi:hypothetical protein